MQYKDKAHLKQLALKTDAGGKPARKDAPKAQHAQQAHPASKKLPAAKRRLLENREDDADLSIEYRYLKKLKQGKITEVGLPWNILCRTVQQ